MQGTRHCNAGNHASVHAPARPTLSSSTMTPRPPTVLHLPSSGVAKTMGDALLDHSRRRAKATAAASARSRVGGTADHADDAAWVRAAVPAVVMPAPTRRRAFSTTSDRAPSSSDTSAEGSTPRACATTSLTARNSAARTTVAAASASMQCHSGSRPAGAALAVEDAAVAASAPRFSAPCSDGSGSACRRAGPLIIPRASPEMDTPLPLPLPSTGAGFSCQWVTNTRRAASSIVAVSPMMPRMTSRPRGRWTGLLAGAEPSALPLAVPAPPAAECAASLPPVEEEPAAAAPNSGPAPALASAAAAAEEGDKPARAAKTCLYALLTTWRSRE